MHAFNPTARPLVSKDRRHHAVRRDAHAVRPDQIDLCNARRLGVEYHRVPFGV